MPQIPGLADSFANLARIAGADIHESIAKQIAPQGAILRCGSCGRSTARSADAVAEFLRSGWPACCGETMSLDPALHDAANDHRVLRDYDRELAALEECVKAMESVDDGARRRVLDYLQRRFGGE